MKTSLVLALAAAGLAVGACASDDITQHDVRGNYATSSAFASESREEFTAAIRDGLADYDMRLAELRRMTADLNEDARDEFSDHLEHLEAQEAIVRTRLQRLEAALPGEWRDQREGVRDAYEDLRDELDDTHEEITEEL